MRYSTSGLTLAGIVTLFLVACGSSDGDSSSSSSGGAANVAPVANAGANQTVSGGSTVTLNGTASRDSDGTVATYTWNQTAGTAVRLSSATTSQPTFSAPTVASATTLTFSLVVTDNRGTPSPLSTVSVTVNPAAANIAPVANAGANQTVTSGVTVTLNGAASTDSDGTIASYGWTQTVGTAVTLANSTMSQPTFVAPTVATATTLTFSLVVTDNRGGTSAAATVNVTVNPGAANVAPVANAGANQTVASGAPVTLNGTASTDSDGSIASYAWTQTVGTAVTLTGATSSQPAFVAPTVATATTLTFSLIVTDNRGAVSAASTVNVTVNAPVAGNVNVTGNITFARVPFATAQQDSNRGLWYAAPVQQPSRGVTVRVLNSANQTVLATGITDNLGNYTLSVANNTSVTIQLVARMVRDTTQPLPRWDVRVQDGTVGNTPYTYTEPGSFSSGSGTMHNVAIPTGISSAGVATGTRASAPFAVLDTIYQGIQAVIAVSPSINFPVLIVDWGSQGDGTFFDSSAPQHIALLSSLASDTDEFDQHVIAHEFGHFIEFNFSRADNIGGSHAVGDKLDPRVAFGEGFGYAFAAIVLNDPVARDSANDNGDFWSGSFNLESNPQTSPAGAPNGNYGCWCSESSVWSILWDLYDNVADPNDTLSIGFQPLWDVLIGPQRTTSAYTTIFSFITALKAARPGDTGTINTLIAAQNIDTNTDAFGTAETHTPTNVPSAAALPVFSTITVGSPVILATVDDAGRYNKLGSRRFLRFTPSSSGTVTITLTSSNPNSADPDFTLQRAGTYLLIENDGPPQPETGSVSVTAGTTYVLDVYDYANGGGAEEGTPGDYNLTVSIN